MSNHESPMPASEYEGAARPLSAQVAGAYAGRCVAEYPGVVDVDYSLGVVTTLEDGTMRIGDFLQQQGGVYGPAAQPRIEAPLWQ